MGACLLLNHGLLLLHLHQSYLLLLEQLLLMELKAGGSVRTRAEVSRLGAVQGQDRVLD